MQPTTRQIGGGPATGLANDFVEFLRQGLTTGTFGNPGQQAFGANPIGGTQGIAGILNSILSPGAGKLGGSLQEMIRTQQAGDISNLRARYSMGGMGAGTPSAYAESLYRSQAAPQAAIQIGQLQKSFMDPMIQAMFGLSQRGIPQAVEAVSPSPFSQLTGGAAGLFAGLAPLLKALQARTGLPGTGGGGGGGGGINFDPTNLLGGGMNLIDIFGGGMNAGMMPNWSGIGGR